MQLAQPTTHLPQHCCVCVRAACPHIDCEFNLVKLIPRALAISFVSSDSHAHPFGLQLQIRIANIAEISAAAILIDTVVILNLAISFTVVRRCNRAASIMCYLAPLLRNIWKLPTHNRQFELNPLWGASALGWEFNSTNLFALPV